MREYVKLDAKLLLPEGIPASDCIDGRLQGSRRGKFKR